jgi:hypothetical protein
VRKPSRWFEIVDGMAYVYDEPFPEKSVSVSIILVDGLAYYRSNFTLRKVWK